MSGIIGSIYSKSGLVNRLGPDTTVSSFKGAQALPNNKIPVESQLVDAGGNQNANGTYTCPATGNYMCMLSCMQDGTSGGGNLAVGLSKNGSWVGAHAYTIAGQYERVAMQNVIPCSFGDALFWMPWDGYRTVQSGYTNITFYLLN